MNSLLLLSVLSTYALSAADWPNYGNDPGGMRHSPLKAITAQNVSSLKIAWTYVVVVVVVVVAPVFS